MPTISPDVMNYTLTLLASSSSLLMSSPSNYQPTNLLTNTTTTTVTTLIENLNITSPTNLTGMMSIEGYNITTSTLATSSPAPAMQTTFAGGTLFSSPMPPASLGIIVNDTGGGGGLRSGGNNGNVGLLDDGWSNKSHDMINNGFIQATFCILYTNIFVLGIFGNVLVCYVVFCNKAMQTVTNLFITNLALSDILLCVLAVPFTPLYTFLRGWIFGKAICHIVPYAQGCSVYISTLTLTSIAVDRFFVIIYPFHPRMKLSTCISIIISIWVVSLLITTPYGYYVKLYSSNYTGTWTTYCEENWPDEDYRRIFGAVTSSMQFLFPFIIILICYICVSLKLNDRANTRPGSRNSRREEADRDRKKRTNRMLIAMVAIFGISWLPINVVNIFYDFYSKSDEWEYYLVVFFIAHCAAMSSACYNPFLYAWLNENFRKEFKQVLPCFKTHTVSGSNGEKARQKLSRVCNGTNDTLQETLVQSQHSKSSSYHQHHIVPRGPTANDDNTIRIQKPTSDTTKQNPSKLISRTSVDDILLSDVVRPTQETIILPSGVLETPFDTPLIPIISNASKNLNNEIQKSCSTLSPSSGATNASSSNIENNTTKRSKVGFLDKNNGTSSYENGKSHPPPSTSTSISPGNASTFDTTTARNNFDSNFS